MRPMAGMIWLITAALSFTSCAIAETSASVWFDVIVGSTLSWTIANTGRCKLMMASRNALYVVFKVVIFDNENLQRAVVVLDDKNNDRPAGYEGLGASGTRLSALSCSKNTTNCPTWKDARAR